jgi:hypothetical protein
MKFEKISANKFKMFEQTALQNLNAIVGGNVDTSRPGTGTHDTAYSSSGGNVDNVRETADGRSNDTNGRVL